MIQRCLLVFSLLLAGACLAANNKTEAVHWGKKQEKLMETFPFKAPRATITIPKVSQAPAIDGVADDACWERATVIDFLTSCKGFNTAPPQRFGIDGTLARNEVRVCYDDRFVYVHFTCWEHLIPMLQKKVTERDGSTWKDDCLEFFFDTNLDRDSEYHVIINPAGTIYDAVEVGIGKVSGDKSFDFKEIEAKVKTYDDRWALEVRFDFASIGGPPKTGQAWGMDFCRQRRAASIEGIYTYGTWAGSPYGFSGRPDIRGDVVFGDLGVHADKLDLPFLGRNELGCQVIAPAKDRQLTAWVEVLNEFGEDYSTKPVSVTAKAGETTPVRVPFEVRSEGIHFATLVVRDGDKTVLNARRGFTVETIRHEIDAIMPGLTRLKEKAQNPEFIASMDTYIKTVNALDQEVRQVTAELVAKPADNARRKEWTKLYERVRSVSSQTTYLVWTKNPYLATSEGDFPSKLEDVTKLDVRAAGNEWEVAALMITNLASEHLNLIVRGTEKVLGLREIRSPVMTPMSVVVEENPNAFGFDTVRGFNLPEATGEPLERLGSFSEIVVPPFGTRQLFLIFQTGDLKTGRDYKGTLQIYALNKNYAPKEVAVQLHVDDFALPTVAALGVHVYNYGGSDAEVQDMFEHKVNTWFLADNGKLSFRDGKVDHSTKGLAARWEHVLKLPGARKGWAYGMVKSYYDWAKKQKGLTYMGPVYKEGFVQMARDMVAVGEEVGLKPSEVMVCAWDEVKGADIDIVVDHLKLLREAVPDLKVALTTQINGPDRDKLVGYIDVWNPAGGYVWESDRQVSKGWHKEGSQFYDKRHDEGCLVWPYVCSTPVRGQDPIGYYRMAGWRAFDCQADGIAFFAWSYLIYRFNGEPIPTRGWEALREGVEDWQYCHLAQLEIERLEKAGKTEAAAKARAEMVAIMQDAMQYGPRPKDTPELASTIEGARTRVAELLLSLKKIK